MLLTISSPIGPDRWAVSLLPETQIAEIALGRDGHCTAALTTDRALSLPELDTIAAFMQEREHCAQELSTHGARTVQVLLSPSRKAGRPSGLPRAALRFQTHNQQYEASEGAK